MRSAACPFSAEMFHTSGTGEPWQRFVNIIDGASLCFRFADLRGGFLAVIHAQNLAAALAAGVVAGLPQLLLPFRRLAILLVENRARAFAVQEYGIVIALEIVGGISPFIIMPDDFVAKVIFAKDGVHSHTDVTVGAVVAVQVDAAGGFQCPVHFQQADAQEAEERSGVVVLRQPGGFDNLEQGLVFVLDLVQPDAVDGLPEPLFGAVLHGGVVGPAPGVLVLAGGGGAVALFVERRVGGDEVHRFAVHAAQDVQVVHIVKDAVGEVLLGHCGGYSIRLWRGAATEPAGWRL